MTHTSSLSYVRTLLTFTLLFLPLTSHATPVIPGLEGVPGINNPTMPVNPVLNQSFAASALLSGGSAAFGGVPTATCGVAIPLLNYPTNISKNINTKNQDIITVSNTLSAGNVWIGTPPIPNLINGNAPYYSLLTPYAQAVVQEPTNPASTSNNCEGSNFVLPTGVGGTNPLGTVYLISSSIPAAPVQSSLPFQASRGELYLPPYDTLNFGLYKPGIIIVPADGSIVGIQSTTIDKHNYTSLLEVPLTLQPSILLSMGASLLYITNETFNQKEYNSYINNHNRNKYRIPSSGSLSQDQQDTIHNLSSITVFSECIKYKHHDDCEAYNYFIFGHSYNFANNPILVHAAAIKVESAPSPITPVNLIGAPANSYLSLPASTPMGINLQVNGNTVLPEGGTITGSDGTIYSIPQGGAISVNGNIVQTMDSNGAAITTIPPYPSNQAWASISTLLIPVPAGTLLPLTSDTGALAFTPQSALSPSQTVAPTQ